jgi:hypothetical protein
VSAINETSSSSEKASVTLALQSRNNHNLNKQFGDLKITDRGECPIEVQREYNNDPVEFFVQNLSKRWKKLLMVAPARAEQTIEQQERR